MGRMDAGGEVRPVRQSTRRRLSFPSVLSVLLVLALLAAVVVVEPAAAQGSSTSSTPSSTASSSDATAANTSESESTSAPVRSDRPDAPLDVRAVATPAGTEVRWTAPARSELAPDPTGYLVVGCGPYAFGSEAATTAANSVCLDEESSRPVRVAADVVDTVVACVPSATEFCVIAVISEIDALQSRAVVVGSGGTPPEAPTDIVAVPGADGRSMELSWTPGADVVQVGSIPPIAQMWEVSRGELVIGRNLTEPRFTHDSCGLGARCILSVRAVSPAGRSASIRVDAVTDGTLAPDVDQPSSLLVPGAGRITGTAGHGATDARPVELSLRSADDGDPVAIGTVAAVDGDGRWSLMLPASVAPGLYRIVARQRGFESISEPVAVAEDHPLTVDPSSAVAGSIATVASSTLRLGGTGITSPPGSIVDIVDHGGFEIADGTTPTQEALALALQSAGDTHRGAGGQASVDAGGSWSVALGVDRSVTSVHIISVTQTIPGVRSTTRHLAVRVLAPTVLRPSKRPSAARMLDLAATVQSTQQNPIPTPTPPVAPVDVIGVAAPSSVVLSWSAVISNSSPVLSYLVTKVGGSAPVCEVLSADIGTQPRCTITGLRNGVPAQFTVVARSAAGDSPSSEPSAPVAPADVPTAPASARATLRAGSVTVAWISRANNGSPITSFTASAVEDPNITCTASSLVALPARNCVVSGLTNGNDYTFVVVATNSVGTSVASSPSAAVRAAAVPAAPTEVTATAGDTTATIGWTAPANNGQPIRSYTARTAQGPVRSCTYIVPAEGDSTNTCTIVGLNNGSSYAFVVTATNVIGASTLSSPSSPVIPATVPGAPLSVTAALSAGTATVQWSASAPNGLPISSYVVTSVQDPSRTCTAVAVLGVVRRSCTISGLDAVTTHSFTVVAINGAGRSASSAPSELVSWTKGPDAPLASKATSTGRLIRSPFTFRPRVDSPQ